jgi:nicotinamidase-related amidase
MPTAIPIATAHTAVLAMDCQAGIISAYAKPAFVDRAAGVLRAARHSGLPVILVQVGFRPGLPEVSERNPLFAAIRSSPERQQLFQGTASAIHTALGPEPGDIVVTKHRVSAFPGTDLEMVLRAREIDTLVLFGIATSGVVLSTLVDASDADFRLMVISDCCVDMDVELHDALVRRLFPKRAAVLTADEFVQALPPRA